MSEHQASTSGVGWGSTSYQNRRADFLHSELDLIISSSVENIRCMMGYIVGLTVILHGLFVSAHDVSASKVHEVMSHHIKSGLQGHIHQDISRFVTEPRETSYTYRGKDLVMEKIVDLIRQSCVPQPNT
jgi:hypothetical protein